MNIKQSDGASYFILAELNKVEKKIQTEFLIFLALFTKFLH